MRGVSVTSGRQVFPWGNGGTPGAHLPHPTGEDLDGLACHFGPILG